MKKPNVVFAPGCFDEFEGTQDELDALVKAIREGFENGIEPEFVEVVDLTDEEMASWESKQIETRCMH